MWDLQRLQAYDKLQQQKQAQASFAPGACVLFVACLLFGGIAVHFERNISRAQI